ncbi:MAG TPA: GNAT family N-acetyltransferase [Thermoplasmata archaeon]|nr:GNAT family N-acetyltransferase [Thermoplasmata archaeon]
MDAPRLASSAPQDELLEIIQSLRHDLRRRDETVTGNWVEETTNALRQGSKIGWFYSLREGGGIAFYSTEGRAAFGHVHVVHGPESVERGTRLSTTMLDALPAQVESIDVGFTGLPTEEERNLTSRLAARPGSRIIERFKMERDLVADDAREPPEVPQGLQLIPVRDVTVEAIADLDRRAFSGTVDELLVGPDASNYQEVLHALLDGRLGRFVDEASTALLAPEPPRLVGALLTGEESPRRAIFLDFIVDPADRRRGYGRFLFRWGLRALRALGYSSVRLWVTSSNTPARQLYESEGLRVTVLASIYRWDRSRSAAQPHSDR